MSVTAWAESIENTSEEQQRGMGFGPFFVHLGHLTTPLDSLMRTPRSSTVPTPWPTAPAPGWLKHQLDADWSLTAWCAVGGEWIFEPPVSGKRRVVHIPSSCSAERRASIAEQLDDPLRLIAAGEAFAFCDALFVLPDESFEMNSFRFHVPGKEPLDIFQGFRGHTRQYPEVITPGVYRAHNKPDEETSRRYRRKARVASNLVKQAVFERHKIVLSNVQARGVLQHYVIIGATDVLDLTYDVNVAKWFALNEWDRALDHYRPKRFLEHDDPDKAFDEYSLIYTVVVRTIGTLVEKSLSEQLAKTGNLNFVALKGGDFTHETLVALPPRNLSPLWSMRAERQSGFGLLGVGPREDDAWGSVLAIHEHAFHPTFSPDGWSRIGGPTLLFDGKRYRWDEDTSVLSDHALPIDDECIQWIRTNMADLERRLNL
jgi:hypothetical protein